MTRQTLAPWFALLLAVLEIACGGPKNGGRTDGGPAGADAAVATGGAGVMIDAPGLTGAGGAAGVGGAGGGGPQPTGGDAGSTGPGQSSCGAPGFACCDGNRCNNGACCVFGVCAAPGASCGSLGGLCSAGACGSCGGAGLVCCPSGNGSGVCTATGTFCSAGICVTCGQAGLPCCAGLAGAVCTEVGLVCNGSLCVPSGVGRDAGALGGAGGTIALDAAANTGTAGVGGTSTAATGGTAGTAASGGTLGSAGAGGIGGRSATAGTSATGGTAQDGGVAGGAGGGGVTSPKRDAAPAENLVANGDFSRGKESWFVEDETGGVLTTATIVDGALCLQSIYSRRTFESYGLITLKSKGRYSFSYKVKSAKGNSQMGARVGQTEPFASNVVAFQPQGHPVTTEWTSHSFTFSMFDGMTNVGVMIQVEYTSSDTVCIDDVELIYLGSS